MFDMRHKQRVGICDPLWQLVLNLVVNSITLWHLIIPFPLLTLKHPVFFKGPVKHRCSLDEGTAASTCSQRKFILPQGFWMITDHYGQGDQLMIPKYHL